MKRRIWSNITLLGLFALTHTAHVSWAEELVFVTIDTSAESALPPDPQLPVLKKKRVYLTAATAEYSIYDDPADWAGYSATPNAETEQEIVAQATRLCRQAGYERHSSYKLSYKTKLNLEPKMDRVELEEGIARARLVDNPTYYIDEPRTLTKGLKIFSFKELQCVARKSFAEVSILRNWRILQETLVKNTQGLRGHQELDPFLRAFVSHQGRKSNLDWHIQKIQDTGRQSNSRSGK